MFNKYWRTYPWYMQMFQLIILVMVFVMFFWAINLAVLQYLHFNLADITSVSESSPRSLINAALLSQTLFALGLFVLPSLGFAYFTHPRPLSILGLTRPPKMLHILLCVVIMIGATPFFIFIAEMINEANLGIGKEMQEANDRMIKAFLNVKTFGQLFMSLFVMAVLAGFGEELLFRGIILRFAAKIIKSPLPPILISALFFALVHGNIVGMPSILIAGTLLGYFYYLTGSLWCNIIAHIVYNAVQILAVYFSSENSRLESLAQSNQVPLSWVIVGLIISGAAFYLLWKIRTPLPDDWTEDYSKEELAEN